MRQKNKMDGVVKSRARVALSKMPELSHWPNREREFSISESDVVKWMVKQPEILHWLFEKARGLEAIEYSSDTRLWKGVALSELKPPVP